MKKIIEIKWDYIFCGVLCGVASLLCFYAAVVIGFNLEWRFVGRLTRDPQTFSGSLIVGSLFLIFALAFFSKSKRVYGHVDQ